MNASTSTERSEVESAAADLRTVGERPTDAGLAAARARITAVLTPTPVVAARSRDAWLKLENLQTTGSFKVRGALNAIARGVEAGDRPSLVAASAGNHGLGVAWAARRFGLSACVVVPRDAPRAKVEGCRALGAEIVVGGDGYEACWAVAHRLAAERGARLVHAFDDPDVIAGQATVGFEIAAMAPDVVLVPVGGGGLAAGVGLALRGRDVRVIGVQVEGADGLRRALRGQAPVRPRQTLADGLRVATAGALTTRICASVLDDVITVREDEVYAAVRQLAIDEHLVVEGAGAVAFAALGRVRARRPLAIITGGNIDPEKLTAAITGRGARS
jgi:threonine dehydratase